MAAVKVPGLASEARALLGEGAPVRGRLAVADFVRLFESAPKRAREVAALAGVAVPARGRLSAATLAQIAEAVR